MFKSIKFFLKSVIFGSLIAGCGLYGVIASIALRIVGKKEYAQWTVGRAFYNSFSTVLGIKITVKNEERLHGLPAVIISNHQSALDILVLGRVFQPGYTVTAKKVLKYFPILGWFMLASGTFFLDRSKGEKARKVLENALKDLKSEKRGLYIFPEGTRSASTTLELLPFKKGAFHLAKQAGIPIIPVVVSNTSTIFNAKSKTFNCGEIVVEVLEPMPTTGLETNEDVTKFTNEIRDKMAESYKKLGFSTVRGEEVAAQVEDEVESTDINTDSDVEVHTEVTPLVSKD
ncbi:1-acyl-sn-glycerol-3-phosphate acyltransferase [[Candida] anglica]|uniref:1-acyl-sn-glycerol-3-phosphate acyltransferase n=1 Tax=[Candida] anglica TaxID=148631 RepID=A0ABP0EG04_9ASCO